jgi:branched-chain amino acid transport system ATP-binding protein
MLRIHDLHAFYGESHILHGIDLKVARGECVTLLGRNGSGRSTTLKSVLGLVGKRTGSIMVNGNEVIAEPTHRMARYGIGYVPEERAIFASLSTEENLMLPPQVASGGMSVDEIYEHVPQPATSAAAARAPSCRAASSRCWRWRASCAPGPSCCCSTRSPRAWRR